MTYKLLNDNNLNDLNVSEWEITRGKVLKPAYAWKSNTQDQKLEHVRHEVKTPVTGCRGILLFSLPSLYYFCLEFLCLNLYLGLTSFTYGVFQPRQYFYSSNVSGFGAREAFGTNDGCGTKATRFRMRERNRGPGRRQQWAISTYSLTQNHA